MLCINRRANVIGTVKVPVLERVIDWLRRKLREIFKGR